MPTFTGTNGADTFDGTGGDDVMSGGGGADRLSGLNGADILNGEDGDDTLLGGTGDDVLSGGGGADNLSGFEGDDIQNGGDGNDTLLGGTGDDLLSGGAGNDVLEGGTGRNRLDGGLGEGNDIAYYHAATTGVTVSLAITNYQDTGYSTDQLVNIRHIIGSMEYGDTLTGGTGDDFLDPGSRYYSGDDPADFVYGGDGNDTISVQGASNGDILDGGAGDDIISLSFGTGVQTVMNTVGPQIYYAVVGDVPTVYGGTGNDRITIQSHGIVDGGAGDDVLTIGIGHAYLLGTGRDWSYIVPAGFDRTVRVTGGSGADLFKVSNPVGVAVITDFQIGVDRVDMTDSYTGSFFSTPITYYQNGLDTIIADAASPTTVFARLLNVNAASVPVGAIFSTRATVTMREPVNLPATPTTDFLTNGPDEVRYTDSVIAYGRGGNDALYASNAASTLNGEDGDDLLVGGSGADALNGGNGDDRLAGGSGTDALSGGNGNDVLGGGEGVDVLNGGDGADRLEGGNGDDTLTGGAGIDTADYSTANGAVSVSLANNLSGGAAGNDTLSGIEGVIGSAFADTLIGSGAADFLTGGGGADTLIGGGGADRFIYAAGDSTPTATDTITDFQTGLDLIDLTGLNATSISVVWVVGGGSIAFAESPSGAFQLYAPGAGLNGVDFAHGGAFGVFLIGSTDAETLTGSVRPDDIVGNGGDDVITGGAGADAIAGGAGRDVFRYVSRGDSNQQTGFDNLYDFTSGEDRIDLTLLNASSISILRTDNGSSFIYAETSAGVFLTTAANRTVQATDITFGSGPNGVGAFGIYLVGSGVNDVLVGTSLADPIAGGAGNDTITGGGGADAMFGDGGADTFVYLSASDSTAAASDGIFGFVSGTDRLDLRAVRTGAADTFGIAYLSGGSYLFVDLGGNGTSDLVIGLAGTTLIASDILWNTGAIGEEPGVKAAGPEVLPVGGEGELFDGEMSLDLSPMTGRWMLDLEGARGFHGQDWYL